MYKRQTKDIADVIVLLEKQVFATPLSLTILENEIRGQSNCLISIAYDSAKPVGFKIGYEYHSDTNISTAGMVAYYQRIDAVV